ncbi:DoxX family protein [Salipaludibacillus sp. HK11]|uniref:DoxX family protein n=1 Tax=Salipaludibacillus sp. HK11 TaxID=3394320 RepID=UPI0039FC5361
MRKTEVGLFIVRVVLGMTFLFHGLNKFQNGLGNIADYFVSLGLPGFLAYVVCVIEFFGGIAMVIGIGTRVVSVLFSIVMLGAIFTVKISQGFIGGLELDVILLAVSIQLALSGSTFLSLNQYIIDSKKSMFSA